MRPPTELASGSQGGLVAAPLGEAAVTLAAIVTVAIVPTVISSETIAEVERRRIDFIV